MDHRIIYLTHMIIVSPMLIYIWYINNIKKKRISESFSDMLLIIGLVTFLYHAYKLYKYHA